MLQREAAAQLPGNWCTFAQNSVMQIRDIEDVMQVRLRCIVPAPWSSTPLRRLGTETPLSTCFMVACSVK